MRNTNANIELFKSVYRRFLLEEKNINIKDVDRSIESFLTRLRLFDVKFHNYPVLCKVLKHLKINKSNGSLRCYLGMLDKPPII